MRYKLSERHSIFDIRTLNNFWRPKRRIYRIGYDSLGGYQNYYKKFREMLNWTETINWSYYIILNKADFFLW